MTFGIIIMLTTYLLTICMLIYGFDKMQPVLNKNLSPRTRFSIIVPFRNEESDFLTLLNSISALNYPKNLFEIIVVNDDSRDNSVAIFNEWQIANPEISSRLLQNIRLSNAPKKDAITTAISEIKNEWIITTDADCRVQQNWLLAFDNCIQHSSFQMVASAVSVIKTKGFLNYFQYVDLLSLQGTTIGSFGIDEPFICNGANFAYTKRIFQSLNGFDNNNNIASGDDVFLLQKAVENCPEKVTFLKNNEAIVYTKSEESWTKLFQQRVRWASKTGSYDDSFGKILAVIVLLTNLSIILGLFFIKIKIWIPLFLIKFSVDYFLLSKTKRFIQDKSFFLPIFSSVFYPIFCVSVAFYSFFWKFDWKGRKFNK